MKFSYSVIENNLKKSFNMWLVPLLSLFVFPLSFPFSFLQGFFLVSIYILTASQYMPGAQSSLLCSKCLYSLSGSPKCMWPRNFKYNLYSINICTFCLNKLLLCSTCCSPISLYKTVIIPPLIYTNNWLAFFPQFVS